MLDSASVTTGLVPRPVEERCTGLVAGSVEKSRRRAALSRSQVGRKEAENAALALVCSEAQLEACLVSPANACPELALVMEVVVGLQIHRRKLANTQVERGHSVPKVCAELVLAPAVALESVLLQSPFSLLAREADMEVAAGTAQPAW